MMIVELALTSMVLKPEPKSPPPVVALFRSVMVGVALNVVPEPTWMVAPLKRLMTAELPRAIRGARGTPRPMRQGCGISRVRAVCGQKVATRSLA